MRRLQRAAKWQHKVQHSNSVKISHTASTTICSSIAMELSRARRPSRPRCSSARGDRPGAAARIHRGVRRVHGGARDGHRAPRSQAREPDARPSRRRRRRCQGPRLRDRQAPRADALAEERAGPVARGARLGGDARRDLHRHARVHVARAVRGCKPSTRARISTPAACCCSSWSPAGCPSRGRRRSTRRRRTSTSSPLPYRDRKPGIDPRIEAMILKALSKRCRATPDRAPPGRDPAQALARRQRRPQRPHAHPGQAPAEHAPTAGGRRRGHRGADARERKQWRRPAFPLSRRRRWSRRGCRATAAAGDRLQRQGRGRAALQRSFEDFARAHPSGPRAGSPPIPLPADYHGDDDLTDSARTLLRAENGKEQERPADKPRFGPQKTEVIDPTVSARFLRSLVDHPESKKASGSATTSSSEDSAASAPACVLAPAEIPAPIAPSCGRRARPISRRDPAPRPILPARRWPSPPRPSISWPRRSSPRPRPLSRVSSRR